MATWAWPVKGGTPGAKFGETGARWASGSHTGFDIIAQKGTDVTAVDFGYVVSVSYHARYGNLVKLRHKGVDSWYAHLSKVDVHNLERVPQGAKIGEVGSTGNATGDHLHLEARVSGTAVDPQKYLEGNVPGAGVGGPGENLLGVIPGVEELTTLFGFITNADNWKRVALFVGGGVLLLIALYLAMNDTPSGAVIKKVEELAR